MHILFLNNYFLILISMKILKNRKWFTLIELLVVIAIIGILSAGATAVYTSQITKARDTTRINDIEAVQAAIEQTYQDFMNYPNTTFATGTWTLPWFDKTLLFIESLPKDSKSTQSCAKPSLEAIQKVKSGATAADVVQTPCDYLYAVKDSAATWVSNQEYNLSTWFEDLWNVESMSVTDEWVSYARFEKWPGKKNFTGYDGDSPGHNILSTVQSCWNAVSWLPTETYMLIRWTCTNN